MGLDAPSTAPAVVRQPLSLGRSLAAGAAGGICLALAGAPFDLVKTRVQQHNYQGGIAALLKRIVKAEGVRGLWRGVVPPLLASGPQFAISFACFDLNRILVRQWAGRAPTAPDTVVDVGLAGALVGVPTSFLYAPADRIKCLQQVDGIRVDAGSCRPTLPAWSQVCVRAYMRGWV